jgi:putative colanic acid biosynthesis glycosyltransferase
MKVLIVNCVYAFGSTGKIVRDIASGLYQDGIEVVVAYGRGGAPEEKWAVVKLASEGVVKVQSVASKLTGDVYGCSPWSTRKLFKLIEKERPDVVNLHCINANTVNQAETIEYLKQHHIKTVLSIHAEFPYTGGCGHAYDCEQWKTGCHACMQFHTKGSQLPRSWFFNKTGMEWKRLSKAYDGFKELVVTCVSPWLVARAKQSPFFKGRKIVSVVNGLNDDVFRPRDPSRLRVQHDLEGKKVVLHVTPNFYSSIKGGMYVLELARRLEREYQDCRLIICGYRGDGKDLPNNVIGIPFTRNQTELAEYYSLADVTLLTSKRETFSMVTAETLCCGTPLVAFKAGGPESIALEGGALFCDFGDADTLYRNLAGVLNGEITFDFSADEAQKKYSKQAMTDAYKQAYEDIIGNRRGVE